MNLDEFYRNNSEDSRVERDLHHKTEFIMTNYWIEKYLKTGMRILEIGAGTGAYSLMYANRCYKVDAVELVKYNLDLLKSKVKSNMDINPVLGNAIDLSMYKDNTFDIVLCLGPLYHLEEKERKKCINEAIRVCKKDGILFFAYISDYLTFVYQIKKEEKYLLDFKTEYGNNFELNDINNIFTFLMPEKMEQIMSEYNVIKLNHVSLDGITRLIKERVNEFSEEEFEIWVKYLKKSSELQSILGYSEHILYICKKI